MQYLIDFSIFDSPIHAYGNITGDIDLAFLPEIGQEVKLREGVAEFKVTSVAKIDGDISKIIISLEDVVLNSKSEAEELATRMESLGLFCIRYDEIS